MSVNITNAIVLCLWYLTSLPKGYPISSHCWDPGIKPRIVSWAALTDVEGCSNHLVQKGKGHVHAMVCFEPARQDRFISSRGLVPGLIGLVVHCMHSPLLSGYLLKTCQVSVSTQIQFAVLAEHSSAPFFLQESSLKIKPRILTPYSLVKPFVVF